VPESNKYNIILFIKRIKIKTFLSEGFWFFVFGELPQKIKVIKIKTIIIIISKIMLEYPD